MIEQLIHPDNLPFSVALALMILLAIVQLIGLGDMLGGDADMDVDGQGLCCKHGARPRGVTQLGD